MSRGGKATPGRWEKKGLLTAVIADSFVTHYLEIFSLCSVNAKVAAEADAKKKTGCSRVLVVRGCMM